MMNEEEMLLNQVIQRQVSVFTLSDERLRKLFILLIRKVRENNR